MREYGFELRLCATLEQSGLPGLPDVRNAGIVARQLGTSVKQAGARVMDVVFVEPGPAFADRVELSPDTIPPPAIESDAGVGRFRPVTEVFDASPEHARRLAEAAVEAGFFEAERRGGRTVVRQVARYPDWFSRLIGVENKPDLDRPGDLHRQLRRDVSLGVLDGVILATESYVTRAHLNRLPDAVGVWRVDFEREQPIEVIREPTLARPHESGIEVVEIHPGRADITPVTAAAKATQRVRVAERAYGKGWRTDAFPACSRSEPTAAAGTRSLPGCSWKDRIVEPGTECGPGCDGFERASPPSVDLEDERDRRTAWDPDPPGLVNEQVSIDRFSTD